MRRLTLVLILLLAAGGARADAWPERPVRMIAPFPAGGAVDLMARLVADVLQRALGQPVFVDNRPGAGGNLGAELLAQASPDGYTLGTMTIGSHGINPSVYRDLPFDPVRDFTPISLLVVQPNVMVVPPSLGVTSVQEFIALAKAKPGQLNAGSPGYGTTLHLCAELFKQMTGTDIVHVPYRGSALALPDLLSGRLAVMFNNLPAALPHIRAGTLKALAVTSRERWPELPDVPTLEEAGLTGFEVSSWYALMGPARLSRDKVDTLNRAVQQAFDTADMRARLLEIGTRAAVGTPEQLGAFVAAEVTRWAAVVKTTGLKVD
jgi:tripartite-type tricarboxylate transporter receptor subunit TctC